MKSFRLGFALVLALLMALAGGFARPAEAGDWAIGASFRVGGAYFSLAFDRYHRHHAPGYYYRTQHRLHYDGYRCGSYCFKRSSYSYHHPSCPLVLHHFRRHGYHPARVWDAYRGHGYGHHSYKHRDYGYRDDKHRDYGYRDYRYRDRGHRDYRYRGDRRGDHRHHSPRYCPYR